MLPGSAEQQKCHMTFSTAYPRLPHERISAPRPFAPFLALTGDDRSTEPVDSGTSCKWPFSADRVAASFKHFVATVALCGDYLVCGLTMRSLSERVLPGHL